MKIFFIEQISRIFAVIDKKYLCFKPEAVLLVIHLSHLKNVQQSCLFWETGYNVPRYKAEPRPCVYASVYENRKSLVCPNYSGFLILKVIRIILRG